MSRDLVSRHPGFLPYRLLRDGLLGLPAAARIEHCNALSRALGLRSAAGAPISFSTSSGSAAGAVGYEAAILHDGRIECRPEGRGAIHDLHNALVWLTFPKFKALLNRLHLEAAAGREEGRPEDGRNRGRGRARDTVTLLDESGLLWVSRSSALDEQLISRDWSRLLVANREQVRIQVMPIIIGHGLLEKLATPYKSMTAHCLICPWPAAPVDIGSDYAGLDTVLADRLASVFDSSALPALVPLPILGLPGWDPANVDPSYYDDARVFRV